MTNQCGLEFLNRLYKDLHNSEIVMHTALSSDDKNEKVAKYLKRLERLTNNAYDNKRKTSDNDIKLLKKFYYDKYVIKENNIPESYFELQKKIALEEGNGHLEYTSEIKKLEIENIISEQKHSLDIWLSYFVSKETDYYPIWFKYYAFQGMLTLGQYDKKANKFTRRTPQTTKPFIEINREAISFIYSYLLKYFDKKEIADIELKKLLEGGSFSKLYAYYLKKIDLLHKDNIKSDEGIWKQYLKGSDPEVLFNDIYGKGTGWCTAGGIETATTNINGGDFYVYYTKDKAGNYTNPRIAIRMQGSSIVEIRGIAEEQNLETNMEEVVEKKLEEFPDKETYKKKVNDMKMMTYIYTKFKNNVELTKEDLRFLYEIDNKIIGFGYEKDPRIKEIINARNNERKDLAMLFSCKEEKIALNQNEALSGNIKYCRCDLDLSNLKSSKGLKLPEYISGDLNLNGLTSAEGLKLPKQIGGNLDLSGLTSAEGLKLPKHILGDLDLSSLTGTKSLELPKQISGDLNLGSLTSAKELNLPSQIGGNLDLSGITSAKGLALPEQIGGSLDLSGLTSAEGLKLPDKIGGYLALGSLRSAKDLRLPDQIREDLYLGGLTSTEGLKLPEQIGGNLDLKGLTSAVGLRLPNNIGGNLGLAGLTSAEGLKLPDKIGGDLELFGLTSAEGLKFPNQIGGHLFLSYLTSAKNLKLPTQIGKDLDLSSLTSAEGLELPKQIGRNLYLVSLISAEGLKLPEQIEGDLCLDGLISAEGLELPSQIGGEFYCPLFNNDFEYAKECLKNQKEMNKSKKL